jgi:outer membrane receptor for ferrienterochelin and colicins
MPPASSPCGGFEVGRMSASIGKSRPPLLGLLLAGMVLPAGAEGLPAPEELTDLSLKQLLDLEVFNAASLLPTQFKKAPGTVYSFDRGDFARLGVRRLEELLRFVPGFQLNQYRKRDNSLWARGMLDRSNDKLVLLVDGIQSRQLYYNHFALGDNLPLERVERVEIILGPASSLYGANAFAGIVSVTTRGFMPERRVEVTAEGGSNDRVKGSAWYSDPKMQLFASYLDQEAPFREDRRSFIGVPTRQPLEEDYLDLAVRLRPLEGLTLGIDYQENDLPYLFIPPTQDAYIEQRPLHLTARYEHGTLEQGRLEAKAYYSRDRITEYEVEQRSRGLAYEERQNGVMAGAEMAGFRRLDDHTLTVGGSWQFDQADEMDFVRYWSYKSGFLDRPIQGELLSVPGVENHNLALFAQDVWELAPSLTLTLGGRFDHYDAFGDYFNYRGALVYTPGEAQVVKFLYGTAIRTPTYREYLKVLESDFVAPVPEPEHIESLELGYAYQWERANIGVTLFHNDFQDYIREVRTPDGEDEYFANSDAPWRTSGWR